MRGKSTLTTEEKMEAFTNKGSRSPAQENGTTTHGKGVQLVQMRIPLDLLAEIDSKRNAKLKRGSTKPMSRHEWILTACMEKVDRE